MAKKNEKRGCLQNVRVFAGTLLGLLVIVAAFILSSITGIDFLSLLETDTGTSGDTVVVEAPPPVPAEVDALSVGLGFGAQKGFWTVYFNAPTGNSDRSTYVNGIDQPLVRDISEVRRTLDIAAYEFDNEALTAAVIGAHRRGVRVRIVTDDEAGLEEEDESIPQFVRAGIPVVDDERSALMHNKFMILDGTTVWTGSWNYTMNGTYRNNNNALAMRSQRAVQAYQTEFNEMFENGEFGPRSTSASASFTQNGIPVSIVFAPEDDAVGLIVRELESAQEAIRFMAFSFTQDDIGNTVRQRGSAGITVEGIFEVRGSETRFSEMPPMFCAGFDVRQDGNPYALHHKVFIVDDTTVLT
ncbi:MAG: phospholipase D-like domain-containing protein, partial [Chloroflexota bacterium]